MLIRKTFWKWNEQYNDETFNLGDVISQNDVENDLNETQRDEEAHTVSYQLQSNAAIYITVNSDNQIIKKLYFHGARVGALKVRSEFRSKVRAELTTFLEECEKESEQDKLMIVYGDDILKAAILIKGKTLDNLQPKQSAA